MLARMRLLTLAALISLSYCQNAAGTKLDDYDKFREFPIHTPFMSVQQTPPPTYDGNPRQISVGFYAESISNFELTKMSFDMDIYLHVSWLDPRLAHNHSSLLTVNDENIQAEIWVPDLYFANAKSAVFQHVTVPNFVFWIDRDGTVSYSVRTTLTVACNLDLRRYPMDTQQCALKINSYAHHKRVMNVSWFRDHAIVLNPDIELPEFQIAHTLPDYCPGTFVVAQTAAGSRTAEFSCLQGRFFLKRSIGYHMVQSYIPTGLIVMISWVSFWIDCNAVPARVSLSFTTLLTLSTMGAGLRYSLPPVSYAKAIDYWVGTCMLFVFGALLEFALVNSLMRQAARLHEREGRRLAAAMPQLKVEKVDTDGDALLNSHVRAGNRFAQMALGVDQYCRVIFPICFLAFNATYWFAGVAHAGQST